MKLSHPFISELKRFVANQNATLGPIVLHLCELIHIKCEPNKHDHIKDKQRKLSQVTDMIHAAHIFHRCVRDNQQKQRTDETSISTAKRLHQDNVMALLVGDYLLAQSSVDMADLRFPMTVGLIAKGLEDYTRGEFLKLQLVENFQKNLLNSREICKGIGRYAQLTCGSLLSNACLSAALLAGYPKLTQGFTSFTNNSAADNIIHRANCNDNNINLSNLVYSFGFHTGSAHRLMEMLYCPDTNSEDDKDFIRSLDVELLNESLHSHIDVSIDLLNKLPDGERRSTLLAMLAAMKDRCLSG